MDNICFPDGFPTYDSMMSILQKTIQKAWKTELTREDIETWFSNFTGSFFAEEDERRIALWFLCNFTFFNMEELNHLCRVLYRNYTHVLMADRGFTSHNEFEESLQRTAFTAIGKASESGGLLLYHFRQETGFSIDRFVFPTVIDNAEYDTIVCVDDVMMSGGTASRFFYKHSEKLAGKTVYYLTVFTSDAAVRKLNELGIKVVFCSLLDERNKAFSPNSICFFRFPSLLEPAKIIAEGYGRIIEPQNPLGYKDGQYCFGFYYNIPNNSLPIFWSANNWNPIFYRKEKYQNAKQENRKYGKFI
jgi:hypothetical protein